MPTRTEILVLATKGTAAEAALKAAGTANLENKTVIDTTNPIADAAPVNGVLRYFTAQNESLMEPLCILWYIPGFLQGTWTHAFKLLKQ